MKETFKMMTADNSLIASEMLVFLLCVMAVAFAIWAFRMKETNKKSYAQDLEDIKRGRYGI